MSEPKLKHFFDASKEIYKDSNAKKLEDRIKPPDGTTLFSPRSYPDEFTAACFVHQTEPWLIVAFKGTTPRIGFHIHGQFGGFISVDWKGAIAGKAPLSTSPNGIFVSQTLVQDAKLASAVGGMPSYFLQGADYVRTVAMPYALQARKKIYLTGHSLGGAIAEFVAQSHPTLAGTCFASPGSTFFTSQRAAITSLIDDNDLIGQFCLHHHVGSVKSIDYLGMALTSDIVPSLVQHVLESRLGLDMLARVANGHFENDIDLASYLNGYRLLAFGLSVAYYHMIDHYGRVLGFGPTELRNRQIINGIAHAIHSLLLFIGQQAHSLANSFDLSVNRVWNDLTEGFHNIYFGLKSLYQNLSSVEIVMDPVAGPALSWQGMIFPIGY